MDFKTGKQVFLKAKQSQMVTSATYKYYNTWLRDFFLYAMDMGAYSVEQVRPNILEGYLIHLKTNRKVRNITINDSYRAIRAFFKFMVKNRYIDYCVTDDVQAPRIEKKMTRTFTAKEIKQILNSFDKSSFIGLRDYTIMETLFGTGIRKMELCGLKLSDLNFDSGFLHVPGKGNKERLVPIGNSLSRTLRAYLTRLQEETMDNVPSTLFVTRSGAPITYSTIQSMFKRLKLNTGLKGERISSHTWRHTFAKNYLLNGGDVFSLQKIMGHSDISTTRKYLNLNENEIKQQHDKFNPLDNLDWLI